MKRIILIFGLLLACSLPMAAQINCGPPGVSGNQSCFNISTSPVPFSNPIPSWGSNTACVNAAAGNIYAMQLCGNLLGAGTYVTPNDFNFPIGKCSDYSFFGGPLWGFADSGDPNFFSSDDSAILLKANGGTRYLIHIDANGVCSPAPGVTYGTAVYARSPSSPTTIFTLQGKNQTQLYQDTVTITCSGTCTSALTTHTLLKDFADSYCITNSYNGDPGWTGGGSVGQFTVSGDDTTFTMAYSDSGVTGQSMRWAVTWNIADGLSGNCDVWDATTGKRQLENGTQGMANITPAYHAGDKAHLHEDTMGLSSAYALSSPVNKIYGNLTGVFYYFIQRGSFTINSCGYPAPAPITGFSVIGSVTSGTFASGDTLTQTGTGATAPIATPIVANNPWPLVLGTITGVPNATGTWIGSPSGAIYTPTTLPLLNATSNYNCDGHGANGYTVRVAGKQGSSHLYSAPGTPLTATYPNGSPCSDLHGTWNFGNLTDTFPAMMTTQDDTNNGFGSNLATLQVAGSNTVCPLSSSYAGIPLYYNEIDYTNQGTGNVLRLAHTYKTGLFYTFDGQSGGGAIQSSTGKYAAFLSDGEGQFGSLSGNPKCNIGGPDWNASDSTHYHTGTTWGSYIAPQSANTGHYVYHVKSCSAGCVSGTVNPVWPQTNTPGVTVLDNTITWETTPDAQNAAISAIQNCRLELMLVNTFTSSAPPPPVPAPATNLFVKSAKLGDTHEEAAYSGHLAHAPGSGSGTAFQHTDLELVAGFGRD